MPTYLIDTNLLLRIADTGAASHSVAISVIEKLLADGHPLYLTAQNIIEFWSVATRPVTSNGLGWDCQVAANASNQFLSQFSFLEDNPTVFNLWFSLVSVERIAGRKVHDTRLVAVMQAYGIEHLLTFNTVDFQRFAGIKAIDPATI
jgi:predicted nucleic acid-binding protein